MNDAAYDKVINHCSGDDDVSLASTSHSDAEGMCNVSPKAVFAGKAYESQLKQIVCNLTSDIQVLLDHQIVLYKQILFNQGEIAVNTKMYKGILNQWRQLCSGITINIDGVMVKAEEAENFLVFLVKFVEVTNSPSAETTAMSFKFFENCKKAGFIVDEFEFDDNQNDTLEVRIRKKLDSFWFLESYSYVSMT